MDAGETWDPPLNQHAIEVSTPPSNTAQHKLAVGGSNVYVVWADTESGNSDIFFSRSKEFSLTFPLRGIQPGIDEDLDPYNAPINSVFDHLLPKTYEEDGTVVGYTQERGEQGFGVKSGDCYRQQSKKSFYINGNYTAAGLGPQYLCYDGHPGIDYRAAFGTEVYAATMGIVRYPTGIVGIRDADVFNVLELDPGNDYKIYYLHLSTHPRTISLHLTDNAINQDFIATLMGNPTPSKPGKLPR